MSSALTASGAERSKQAESLAGLGPACAPTLWALLCGHGFGESTPDLELPTDLVREVVSEWPADEVVRHLVPLATTEIGIDARLTLVEMLSWSAGDASLGALLDVLASAEPVQLLGYRVPRVLEQSLGTLLSSRPRLFRILVDRLPELPPELLPAITRAMGGMNRPEAASVLSRLADLGLEDAVLAELGRRGDRLVLLRDDRCLDVVHSAMRLGDRRQRQLAAVALGRLGDHESALELIRLLEDDDSGVRRAALGSLQRLTGISRQWSLEQWNHWLDAEQAWFERAPELAREVNKGEPFRAVEALHELASHRLFAGPISELLWVGLENGEASIRARVCEFLGLLAHSASIPALIEALADPQESVRLAATHALTQVTGLELGESLGAWRDWHRSL